MPSSSRMTGSCCFSLLYISSFFILITYYWFSMFESVSSTKYHKQYFRGTISNTKCILINVVFNVSKYIGRDNNKQALSEERSRIGLLSTPQLKY